MDVDLVSKNPVDRSAAGPAARPRPLNDGFAATMAAQVDDGASTIERAERLIGARVRAPEGGCGCDALINAVVPSSPDQQSAGWTSGRSTSVGATQAPAFAAPPLRDVTPGQVLTLDDPADLSSHLHRAILRNATEMITASRTGLVEVRPVPWDQIRQR